MTKYFVQPHQPLMNNGHCEANLKLFVFDLIISASKILLNSLSRRTFLFIKIEFDKAKPNNNISRITEILNSV